MKRILSLLLIFVFAVTLFAGCGSKGDDNNNTGNGVAELTIEEKILGKWNVEDSTMEPYEGFVVEEYSMTFTNDGKVKLLMKSSYMGESMEETADGAYSINGEIITISIEDSEPIDFKYSSEGDKIILTTDTGILTLYK